MSAAAEWDAIGIERLQEVGSVKWSRFPGTIGAFVAEMDFGTAPVIADAMKASIDDGLLGYLPEPLEQRLRAACAAWQRDRYGWDVPAENVRSMPDVLTVLRVMISRYTPPGSKVVVPTPAYMPFLTIPPLLGREVVQVPMLLQDGRYVFDLDAIDAALADAGLLVLCNPYNPLGRVFERDELLALAEVVERHGARVFSDEIHAPLTMPGTRHVPYASLTEATAAHTITATSASKAFNMPGLRAAQVILSNAEDAASWDDAAAEASGAHPSTIGVLANAVAYESGGPWLAELVDYLDGNRRRFGELLAELIPDMGYVAPQGTYIALLDARRLGIEGSPADFFREHARVALTDGIACGEAGEGHVRIILATPRPILEEAVRRMAAALAR
ncbi:MalY/PatB family protein [Microbacterium gorillae]|uniref:MalY/PatB family protein n=1 Tax=Microbacterium gorillae TaxID=1231063 RepID=UPI00058D1507|nr:aminotransferase class I/II-fold pyridoxal phosphate-dependent enzyme [Microbacterium gorillae]